jgi:hypothetical protein
VLAAAHSLPEFSDVAIAVLEELQTGTGLHAIAAEHALTEFRGRALRTVSERSLQKSAP